jgi:CBS domain containing-hemolysin-like protein
LLNTKNKSFIYLLVLPSSAIIFGAIGLYIVEKRVVEETSINSLDDAFWFAIVTMSTVGYGEIYPHTIEGKIITILLLFAGMFTFFGFLSPIAGKFINPVLNTKIKQEEQERKEKEKKDNTIYDYNKIYGKSYNYNLQNNNSKNWIKEQIENIEVLDKSQFADFIITLTNYYNENYTIKQK